MTAEAKVKPRTTNRLFVVLKQATRAAMVQQRRPETPVSARLARPGRAETGVLRGRQSDRSSSTRWLRQAAFVGGGAALGFAYYYFIGCASGSCPITSNPYIATAYGGLLGLLFGRG